MTMFWYHDSLSFFIFTQNSSILIYPVCTNCINKSPDLVSSETREGGSFSTELLSLLCLCQKVLYNTKTYNGVGQVLLTFHHKHGNDQFFNLATSREKLELSFNLSKVRHLSSRVSPPGESLVSIHLSISHQLPTPVSLIPIKLGFCVHPEDIQQSWGKLTPHLQK